MTASKLVARGASALGVALIGFFLAATPASADPDNPQKAPSCSADATPASATPLVDIDDYDTPTADDYFSATPLGQSF